MLGPLGASMLLGTILRCFCGGCCCMSSAGAACSTGAGRLAAAAAAAAASLGACPCSWLAGPAFCNGTPQSHRMAGLPSLNVDVPSDRAQYLFMASLPSITAGKLLWSGKISLCYQPRRLTHTAQ